MHKFSITIGGALWLIGNSFASQESINLTLIDACRTTNLRQVIRLLTVTTDKQTCSDALIKVFSRRTRPREIWNKENAITIMKLLFEHGANPNMRDLRDKTAFDYINYDYESIFTQHEMIILREVFEQHGYQEDLF